MSKITLLAVGSRGDVNPACALAIGLQRSGYQVCIATHSCFHDFVAKRGIEFAEIAGNYEQLLNSEVGLKTLATRGEAPRSAIGKRRDEERRPIGSKSR